jgi:DNA-binding XRE family transcriptional regulator
VTGDQLRRARKRLGLTQAQLGAILKIAPNSVARLERGERKIDGPLELAITLLLENHKNQGGHHGKGKNGASVGASRRRTRAS